MIKFNKPTLTGRELEYVAKALTQTHLAGDGPFTKRCHALLEQLTGSPRAFLTHSCTSALEMSALLLDLQPGDEVIMPSFTFTSTANAFVLRGAVPVFVDIRPDTLNLDESLIEAAITKKTKAIVPVHYAGVACEMDVILEIANRHGLAVVEDAAQCMNAYYRGKHLGTLGELGTFSFHESKNLSSGEGGALLVNDPRFELRAEILREKGTNRSQLLRGEVSQYTWHDVGSSYLPSEVMAAMLACQLEDLTQITEKRLGIWNRYHNALADLENRECIRRPIVPDYCQHNAHIYYVLFPDPEARDGAIAKLKRAEITSYFHYIPLHSAPAGRRFARTSGDLTNTDSIASRLMRLPIFVDLPDGDVDRVIEAVFDVMK